MPKRPAKVKRWVIAWRGANGRYYLTEETWHRKDIAQSFLDADDPCRDGIVVLAYIAVDAAWWERNGP